MRIMRCEFGIQSMRCLNCMLVKILDVSYLFAAPAICKGMFPYFAAMMLKDER